MIKHWLTFSPLVTSISIYYTVLLPEINLGFCPHGCVLMWAPVSDQGSIKYHPYVCIAVCILPNTYLLWCNLFLLRLFDTRRSIFWGIFIFSYFSFIIIYIYSDMRVDMLFSLLILCSYSDVICNYHQVIKQLKQGMDSCSQMWV